VEETGGGVLVNGQMIIGKLGKTVGAEYTMRFAWFRSPVEET